MAAKIYDFQLTAGGVFNLGVIGTYYRILTCTGPIEVRRSGGSVLGPINAGQGERESPFQYLTLVDKTGSVNSGTILVTDANFVDDRITGEVSFVDGSKVRSLAGQSFSGAIFSPGSAGNISHAQIHNPSATKNFFVTQIIPSTTLDCSIQMTTHNAALSTAVSNALNKRVGGATGVIENRVQQAASYLAGTNRLLLIYVKGSSYLPIRLTEPILIPPGLSIVMAPQAVNQELILNYEGFEEVLP